MEPVTYVLKSAGLGGGTRVVLEHVDRLHKRGYDVSLYYTEDSHEWFGRDIPAKKFPSLNALAVALKQAKGIKVATWFETAFWVKECLNPGDRPYYLIQDIEESYAFNGAQKDWILSTYKLGLKPLTTSKWVASQLSSRFDQTAAWVSLGVDFDKFKPVPGIQRDRLRILTQCRPWTAGPNLKGWDTAKQASEMTFEANRATSIVTFSVEPKQPVRPDMPHIHIQNPKDEELNEIFASSGLYLLSSNHEGFALTAAEAMAVGIPVVSTRAQGNEEFCLHGRTALLANAKDSHVLSHHMQHLFNNEDYAANLAAQGHEFIKQYTWDRSIDALELELFGKGKVIDPVVVEPGLVSFGKADCTIEYPKISYPYKHIKEEVTIIIPTVNDYKKVTACIGSLSHQLSGREDYEVIVVDDGTQDKEILDNLELMSESMKFRLIKNGMNLGFSASVNRGLIESTGRYTVLLNNDVLLMDNCLRELVKLGDSDEKIGVIGAKLLYPDHRIQHGGMNKLPNSLYFPHMSRYMARDDPAANVTRKVWAVTGAVFAIKRQALEILGGFSTAYATAWEDVDYCMHAWDNGLQVYYCAEAEAIHLECATRGLTFEDRKKRPLIWMEREKAGENYFTRKWAGVAHLASPEYLNSRS